MEDENYRMLVVTGLNRTLDRKISPDDHIDDYVSLSLFHVVFLIFGLMTLLLNLLSYYLIYSVRRNLFGREC